MLRKFNLLSDFKCHKPCQMKPLSLSLWGGAYGKVNFASAVEIHSAPKLSGSAKFSISQGQL